MGKEKLFKKPTDEKGKKIEGILRRHGRCAVCAVPEGKLLKQYSHIFKENTLADKVKATKNVFGIETQIQGE